jgi:hypothetical protein
MGPAQHTGGAEPFGLETGHAGLDAKFFGRAVGGNDYAIAAPAAADPDGPPGQGRVQRDFATGEERISVHMQNTLVARAHWQKRFYPSRAIRP